MAIQASLKWLLASLLVAAVVVVAFSTMAMTSQLRARTATERRQTCYEQVRNDVAESTAIAGDPAASAQDRAILEMTRARYVGEMSRCYQLDPR